MTNTNKPKQKYSEFFRRKTCCEVSKTSAKLYPAFGLLVKERTLIKGAWPRRYGEMLNDPIRHWISQKLVHFRVALNYLWIRCAANAMTGFWQLLWDGVTITHLINPSTHRKFCFHGNIVGPQIHLNLSISYCTLHINHYCLHIKGIKKNMLRRFIKFLSRCFLATSTIRKLLLKVL